MTLEDIRAARTVAGRRRQAHPDRHLRHALRADRRRRRAQGREPPADGGVQDPRRDEQAGVAGPGCRQRRHRRERRQPRPGAGVRRPPLRRAVRHLRAVRRPDHQDRGLPGPTAPRSSRAAPRSTRRSPPRRHRSQRGGHGVLPPVRRPRRRRRPGHARAGARRRPRRPGLRRRPARRRRARAGRGHRREVAAARRCASIGVQAAVCAPYAGGPSPAGPVRDAGRRHRRQAARRVTGPLVERWVDEIVAVDEDAIADAMVRADGPGQAVRRGRRRRRRGRRGVGAGRRPPRPARRAWCCRAATSTSASCPA